jgi:hypothetical protein
MIAQERYHSVLQLPYPNWRDDAFKTNDAKKPGALDLALRPQNERPCLT